MIINGCQHHKRNTFTPSSWWEHTLPLSKYSYPKTKPESHQSLDLPTDLQEIQGQRELLSDTAGMQPSQPRLWETLQKKWPASSINKLQGKMKVEAESIDGKRLNRHINQSQQMNLIWILIQTIKKLWNSRKTRTPMGYLIDIKYLLTEKNLGVITYFGYVFIKCLWILNICIEIFTPKIMMPVICFLIIQVVNRWESRCNKIGCDLIVVKAMRMVPGVHTLLSTSVKCSKFSVIKDFKNILNEIFFPHDNETPWRNAQDMAITEKLHI